MFSAKSDKARTASLAPSSGAPVARALPSPQHKAPARLLPQAPGARSLAVQGGQGLGGSSQKPPFEASSSTFPEPCAARVAVAAAAAPTGGDRPEAAGSQLRASCSDGLKWAARAISQI